MAYDKWDSNNDWSKIKIKKEFDYYKKMIPSDNMDHDFERERVNEIINKIINDEARTSTMRKATGTENHFGDREDVKQPLTLDPALDF